MHYLLQPHGNIGKPSELSRLPCFLCIHADSALHGGTCSVIPPLAWCRPSIIGQCQHRKCPCVQAVALRWVLDQGVMPVVAVAWGGAGGAFGKRGTGEAASPDLQLFQRRTFLDEDDLDRLSAALA